MSKIIHGQNVCEGCKWQSLHYCLKYNTKTVSMCLYSKRQQICCEQCVKENGFESGIPLKSTNVTSKNKIAYFHMPGPEHLRLWKTLIIMKKKYPEAFYPNREISEVYGAFPGAIWNGRTPNFYGQNHDLKMIEACKKEIEELGISLNLTWNNHLVSGTDVYDRFCNAITEIFHNGKHSITVASPELFEYLHNKYPNFTYYQSVITTEQDKTFVKKDERFNMYLWNRALNNNWEELLKVPYEERKNFEFLCNDACTPICNRTGHYNHINKLLLDRKNEGIEMWNYCTIDHDFMTYNLEQWPITINSNDIDKYVENGYQHFKLCSRGDAESALAYKMAKYFAKPEYHADVMFWMLQSKTMTEEEVKNRR